MGYNPDTIGGDPGLSILVPAGMGARTSDNPAASDVCAVVGNEACRDAEAGS
jgi:hypothetical protein